MGIALPYRSPILVFRNRTGGIKCPQCGSEKVEQKVAAFSAVTSKKS